MPEPGFDRLGEDVVHSWGPFTLVHGEFTAPGGERFDRTFLRHPGAVGIVALDGDSVVLVRQYRAALGRDLLEIPAGTLDHGDDESPLTCARRELAEEVGATAGRIDHLASYVVAPGVSSEVLHLFLARDLTHGARAAQGLEEENMTVERLRLSDAVAAIASGVIEDAKTIIGLLLASGRVG